MRARRALMYMPGDDLHKIHKATTLDVDCICMDMEDGVALNRKAEARQIIADALAQLNFGRSERLVRINAIGSGLEEDDLQVVIGTGIASAPDGVVVPKVERVEQVHWISDHLATAEKRHGWLPGGIVLIVQIESALGLVRIRELLTADARLQAVILGAEDLAADIGALRTPAAWEVFYARSMVVTHAAACNLQAIDMVFVDLHDLEGLRSEALQGAQMGFAGKQIIHPNQVAPVQQAFTPSEAEVAHARQVMAAFEAHEQQGRGAFALHGKMVDAPIVKAAQRVLERARAAGKI